MGPTLQELECAACDVIQIIKQIPELQSSKFSVIGGLALWSYLREGRSTENINFLTSISTSPSAVKKRLLQCHNSPFVQRSQVLFYRSPAGRLIQVDISPEWLSPYLPAAAKRARDIPYGEVPYISALDLIIFKLDSSGLRSNIAKKQRDAADAAALLDYALRHGFLSDEGKRGCSNKTATPLLNTRQQEVADEALIDVVRYGTKSRSWWEARLGLNQPTPEASDCEDEETEDDEADQPDNQAAGRISSSRLPSGRKHSNSDPLRPSTRLITPEPEELDAVEEEVEEDEQANDEWADTDDDDEKSSWYYERLDHTHVKPILTHTASHFCHFTPLAKRRSHTFPLPATHQQRASSPYPPQPPRHPRVARLATWTGSDAVSSAPVPAPLFSSPTSSSTPTESLEESKRESNDTGSSNTTSWAASLLPAALTPRGMVSSPGSNKAGVKRTLSGRSLHRRRPAVDEGIVSSCAPFSPPCSKPRGRGRGFSLTSPKTTGYARFSRAGSFASVTGSTVSSSAGTTATWSEAGYDEDGSFGWAATPGTPGSEVDMEEEDDDDDEMLQYLEPSLGRRTNNGFVVGRYWGGAGDPAQEDSVVMPGREIEDRASAMFHDGEAEDYFSLRKKGLAATTVASAPGGRYIAGRRGGAGAGGMEWPTWVERECWWVGDEEEEEGERSLGVGGRSRTPGAGGERYVQAPARPDGRKRSVTFRL